MIIPNLDYEHSFWKTGKKWVVGLDEVGRGALAGPVVAAAAVFSPDHQQIAGVRDSKTLSKSQKNTLNNLIISQATSIGIGQASPQEIDVLGIVPATSLAMQRALNNINNHDVLLIDGRPFGDKTLLREYQKKFIVKGDALCYSIAAASVVAKVFRDTLMHQSAKMYTQYSFEKNVGYGTRKHLDALHEWGPSAMHRLCFLKKQAL